MRKTKQRKLRAEFAAKHGRQPNGVLIVEQNKKGLAYIPSEWRRLKKGTL